MQLEQLIGLLEKKTIHSSNENSTISSVNVAWHIDHSLKVINSVIATLQKSDAKYRWDFNWKRMYFFLRKSIPRGKARAPKAVQSFEEITIKDIERQLKTARFLIQELETMDKNTNFIHPFIGRLNLKQAILFLEIHTQHHLAIIDDIIQ
ncbi:DinB family protein [Flavobacterium sp.]